MDMQADWLAADTEFVNAVENCTLPGAEFTHKAHVRLAWLYLLAFPFDEALQRMESSIVRYATHLGAADKYHRTITVAWMRLVVSAMNDAGATSALEQVFEANPNLLTTRALDPYYSSELLKSANARTQFVDPDLAPLPEACARAR